MSKNQHIEERIESTLNSVEGIQRAEASPFLFTRVEAALYSKQSTWGRFSNQLAKPSFALATAILVLILNFWAFNASSASNESSTVGNSSDVDQMMANEYSLTNTASETYLATIEEK